MRAIIASFLVALLALPAAIAGPAGIVEPHPQSPTLVSDADGILLLWSPEPTASSYSVYRQHADEPTATLIGVTRTPSWYDTEARYDVDVHYTIVAHMLDGHSSRELRGGGGDCIYQQDSFIAITLAHCLP